MIWEANGAGPDRNYGETAIFEFGRKAKNGPKIRFLLSQPPKICFKTDIYLGKGYFFLLTTLPGRGRNMVRVKKCYFFFGLKIRISAQKSVFDMGPRFLSMRRLCASALAPFRHLRIYCATFRFRVTPVFVWGPVRRAKKSNPTPL